MVKQVETAPSKRGFVRNDNGNVAMLFALSCLVIFPIVGFAIDFSRVMVDRHKLHMATDAAALSAAHDAFMTDGDFNIQHPAASRNSYQQSVDLCDQMKVLPSHIQIFTVGFQASSGVQRAGDGRTILEYCATSPGHAFSADNGEELTEACRPIARSNSDLRLKH
jgi:uncharacterized membrane protein